MTIKEHYLSVYRSLTEGSEPRRFMVFEPVDRTGWGNRLRGLTLSFLMAAATRRILVIKDFLLEENFDPPEGALWRYRDWKSELEADPAGVQRMDLHLQPSNWNQKEWDDYRSLPMDQLFPGRILILNESIGFFDQLVANPHYSQVWKTCGLEVSSKVRWLGQVTEILLDRPRSRLQAHLRSFEKRWSKTSRPDTLVQFRTFYDIGSPNEAVLEHFIQGVVPILRTRVDSPAHVYVATDSEKATQRIGAALASVATVSVSQTKVVHTGALHNGWELVADRILTKLFRREFHFFDFWFWLPEQWRPRPHTAILAEWLFMGTCSLVFSTFTSFTVYAMARTGNRALLYRFDADKGIVEPLTDQHYFF